MANPGLIKGMVPLNPNGRPKNSVRSIKGMLERFVRRNASPRQLQKMFDGLREQQKLEMITEILPYVLPKQQADSISHDEINKLYDLLKEKANNETKSKAS